MTLLKSGTTFSTAIVSKMVYSCNICNHVDIVSGRNFNPNAERKCPKCQALMILQSTNTDLDEQQPNDNDNDNDNDNFTTTNSQE